MSNKFRPQHGPRPTKGALVVAAKEQAKMNEVIEAVVAGDQKKAADLIVEQVKATTQEESTGAPTPAPEAKPVSPPPAAKEQPLYSMGKKYVPKTDRNIATWGKLCEALKDGPKTLQQLTTVVKEANHGDFLGYMTRGGHIIPYVASVPESELRNEMAAR